MTGTDYVTASQTLEAALAGFTALPIFGPNDERDVTPTTAPLGFVYCENRVPEEKPISFGPAGSQWRRDLGEFWIYVYVPRGTRVGTARSYAQQIRQLFPVNLPNGVFVTRKLMGVGQQVDGPGGKVFCIPLTIYWFADRQE